MGDHQVSSTRLYLGNLPRDVTKEEIQGHFKDSSGTITEIKLMNGFGFLEYEDATDARDVVPAYHGSDLNGSRLTVQFARQQREPFAAPVHSHPRPRRTAFRMQITGLPGETSWQDLKDFARRSGLDVVYSEVGREGKGFVEFETSADLKTAVEKLDNSDFKGTNVRCTADEQSEAPRNDYRHRSRSPPYRRGGYPSNGGYYNSRRDLPPSRDYSPHRDNGGYRRRSPPPRDHYYNEPRDHDRYRSPPRGGARGPPYEGSYPAGRGGHDDGYGQPPSRRYEEYPTNGYRSRPGRTPPRDYDYNQSRRYW